MQYLLEGEHLEAVYDAGGDIKASFLRGVVIDEVVNGYLYDAQGNKTNYTFHHDNLRSVTGLSGHDGSTLETTEYGTFGDIVSSTGSSDNFLKYTGRELDPTGLYYYRARYYDPEIGRFLSEDPKGFDAGVNFYAYVGGNPVNMNDPTGMCMGIDDVIVWCGIKVAEYAVLGTTHIAGQPMTEEQFNKMDATLMHAWQRTTTVTPYVVGGATVVLTGNVAYGSWATWASDTTITLLAGGPYDEIGLPPISDSLFIDIFDGIDIFNPIPLNEGEMDYLNGMEPSMGGFVLYPNKPNTNFLQKIYSK